MQPHETQIQPMEKEAAMTNEQILAEIREANLTYLMLAQNLIRQDKAEAVFRLGLNEEAADILASLSAAQVLKLASRNTLLCSFRVDDNLVWSLLTNHTAKKVGNEATNTLHANIPDGQPRVGSAVRHTHFSLFALEPDHFSKACHDRHSHRRQKRAE